MSDLWSNVQFFWPTLLAAASLAVAGGIGGTVVILRRQSLLALSLPPIVTLGAAIGLRMDWPTLPPAIGCLIVALTLVAQSARRRSIHLVLPAIFVAGLCLPILVVADSGAELIQVQNLFVGIDIAVAPKEASMVAAVLVGMGIIVLLLWRRWMLLAQSSAAAELAGLHPARWDALLLILVATILLLGTTSLGAAMTIVMLFLPPAVSLPWTHRLHHAMLASALVGLILLLMGFVVAIEKAWPLSQSVGGMGLVLFLISQIAKTIHQKNHCSVQST